MVMYYDGRFVIDKMFSFHTLDFMILCCNQSNGRFFVNEFCGDYPTFIEEMKERIANGDIDIGFIKITIFHKHHTRINRLLEEKNKVHSWIRYHVEADHGPHTVFITLSYTEYFWPYVMRLLHDHLQ